MGLIKKGFALQLKRKPFFVRNIFYLISSPASQHDPHQILQDASVFVTS